MSAEVGTSSEITVRSRRRASETRPNASASQVMPSVAAGSSTRIASVLARPA